MRESPRNLSPAETVATDAPGRWTTTDNGIAGVLLLVTLALLILPASFIRDLGPRPDALEYAISARSLARFEPFGITLFGEQYPTRYAFGFPAMLAPVYWFPGTTLASGIYGVLAYSAAAVALVYALGRQLADRQTGVAAAVVLLCQPLFSRWSWQIMSETATVAIAAAVALLLLSTLRADRAQRRLILAAMLGVACGLGILVRVPNAIIGLSAALGLWVGLPQNRKSTLAAFAAGPVIAVSALGIHAQVTFGSPTGTGYRFWVPYWFESLDRTFALRYAILDPADAEYAGGRIPNLVAYPAIIVVRMLNYWLVVPVLAGLFALGRTRNAPVRATVIFAAACSAGIVIVYSLYFYQTSRFVAPLAPFAAIAAGAGILVAFRMLRGGAPRRRRELAIGLTVILASIAGLVDAARQTVLRSFPYQEYVTGAYSRTEQDVHFRTAALYDSVAPANSILVSEVSLPFLEEEGLTSRHELMPFERRHYWAAPPLRHRAVFEEQQRMIASALERGVPVLTDSHSIEKLREDRESYPAAWEALQQYRLQPFASGGNVALFRIVRGDARIGID